MTQNDKATLLDALIDGIRQTADHIAAEAIFDGESHLNALDDWLISLETVLHTGPDNKPNTMLLFDLISAVVGVSYPDTILPGKPCSTLIQQVIPCAWNTSRNF